MLKDLIEIKKLQKDLSNIWKAAEETKYLCNNSDFRLKFRYAEDNVLRLFEKINSSDFGLRLGSAKYEVEYLKEYFKYDPETTG